MTIGLDPHVRQDRWWIYDYFPGALTADRARCPSTDSIRAQLSAAGFVRSARLQRDRPELHADLRLYATIGWRG